jgi:tetratricopeptide (TPR) repeat protein
VRLALTLHDDARLSVVRTVDPDVYEAYLNPGYVQAHQRLSTAYLQLGRTDEALEEAETVRRLMGGSPPGVADVAGVYASAGRRREAEQLRQQLMALREREYVPRWSLAQLSIALQDHDAAFFWLERAFEERSNGLAYLVPYWGVDPVRSDPRFQDLLRRVGLDGVATNP